MIGTFIVYILFWWFAGTIYFGTEQGTDLFLSGANILGTTNHFKAWGSITAVGGIYTGGSIVSDTADTDSLGSTSKEWLNLYIGDAGKIFLGLAQDVNLYRDSANWLKTDDDFECAKGTVWISHDSGQLKIGSAADCILYRGAADQIFTDDLILSRRTNTTDYAFATRIDADASWFRFAVQAGGALVWGAGEATPDTNLYRSAANILKTDDSFLIGSKLLLDRSSLTISDGVITTTKSYHWVDTEGAAAADNLDIINGGTDGQILVLRTVDSGRDVTLRDAVGNLQIAGNFTLATRSDRITLLYDGDLALWVELSRSTNV